MKRWGSFLFYGWITLTLGLFLAIILGRTSSWMFTDWNEAGNIVQAIMMSILVIPITLYLYKGLCRQTTKPATYPFSKFFHILTGLLFPVRLAVFSLLAMNILGWVTLEEWQSSPVLLVSCLYCCLSAVS